MGKLKYDRIIKLQSSGYNTVKIPQGEVWRVCVYATGTSNSSALDRLYLTSGPSYMYTLGGGTVLADHANYISGIAFKHVDD